MHDVMTLQDSQNRLKEWSDIWQLQISTTKCVNMNLLKSRSVCSPFTVGDDTLPVQTAVKDLGMTVNCSLKYSKHVDSIVGRARQRVGLLFKCFVTRHADSLIRAFKVYIRPILEYASNIWSPIQIGLNDKLESVQRRFTKRIPGFESLSYSERLSLLNLESLELCRLLLI